MYAHTVKLSEHLNIDQTGYACVTQACQRVVRLLRKLYGEELASSEYKLPKINKARALSSTVLMYNYSLPVPFSLTRTYTLHA